MAKLPLASVLNRGTGPAVYVVDDAGALTLRPVTVAAFTADAALVSAGVNDGDRIVTLGVQKLEAGLQGPRRRGSPTHSIECVGATP